MVALGMAVLDRKNRPLYLQEFGERTLAPSDEELMGLDLPASESLSCSTRLQFIMHGALDRLDQLVSLPSGQGIQRASNGTDGKFVGLLMPVEEMRVYGYVTATQTKFLLVVEDEASPETQTNADEEIKRLLVNVHSLYVADLLNPFKDIGSPIVSKRFRDGIQQSVVVFNQTDGL